jgi:ArsR family transcriptional regulator
MSVDALAANVRELPVALFRALSDPTRLRAALLLALEGELCVCELTQALQVSQPKMSRHLAVLRESGLVRDRRRGTWIHYRLNESLPDWLPVLLQALAAEAGGLPEDDRARLRAMANRPKEGCT